MLRFLLSLGFLLCAQLYPADARSGPVEARSHMIVAGHPLAAQAGLAMLDAGGSAIDAAIAAQLVLGLVEPQFSGIGGGGFLLAYDKASGALEVYDGRERAPAAATPDQFLKPDGTPMGFYEAVVGGLSIGVPGTLRALEAAHRDHGKLPWAKLFEPAIALAEHGFPISPHLAQALAEETYLPHQPEAAAYFYDSAGQAWPAGHVLTNPAYAETLKAIAAGGADAFYTGPIAADIIAAVARPQPQAGRMTLADLSSYQAERQGALCGPYRGFRVCGAPPPSSGGLAILEILGLLGPFDLKKSGPSSLASTHLIAEAEALAFADRNRYVADPDFVVVPVKGLTDPAYLALRAHLIDPAHALGKASAGAPEGAPHAASDAMQFEPPSTSHMSIVDGAGNAVSFTTSIENSFGSRRFVDGFLLNNQLTDFSFQPLIDGKPIANRVEPGKRPRSSMAPTMVFNADGTLRLVTGSPGGSLIIGYVVKSLIASLDWDLDPQAAAELANLADRNGPLEIERPSALEALAPELQTMGHTLAPETMDSGLNLIGVSPSGLLGGADPRREGAALGH